MTRRTIVCAAVVAPWLMGCGELIGLEERQPHTLSLRGRVVDAARLGVPDVLVCLPDVGPAHCTVSGSDGTFTLVDIPGRTTQRLKIGGGATNTLRTMVIVDFIDEDIEVVVPSLPQSAFVALLGPFGFDEERGHVGFALTRDADDPTNPGALGYVVSLEPAAGLGPLHLKEGGSIVSQPETIDFGVGVYINVPAGRYTVTTDGPGNCIGLPSAANDLSNFKMAVEDGWVSTVLAECKPFL